MQQEYFSKIHSKTRRSVSINHQKGFILRDLRSNRLPLQLKKSEPESGAVFLDNRDLKNPTNNTGLPNNLKSGIENLSGYTMDDVRVYYNSIKPAQLNAHAYAQGTDIHLASGQEKHLPHEAWHVVQQKQGRVKPTTQLKGKVNINDDSGLENEADVMGAKAAELKINPKLSLIKSPSTNLATTKQLTKNTTVGGTIAGATALGAAGAYGGAVLGSAVPVIGTIAGGVIGGLIGAGIGALIGYFLAKPKLYKNNQVAHYDNELEVYQGYREQHANAESAYDKGTIIRYSAATSNNFNLLLHMGQVLYTYDKGNQLSIGSNAGPIKHAIVAQNQDVKAAGMAIVNFSEAQANKGEYDSVGAKVQHWQGVLADVQEPAQVIIGRFAENPMGLQEMADALDGEERQIIQTYRTCLDQLDHWGPEMGRLGQLEHADIIASKNNQVQLDNESGHFHPGPKTKDEAFEGWNDAGYHNLTWRNH